jgi:hypothetical protein
VELSHKHPRYGYRRITALLRREGFVVLDSPAQCPQTLVPFLFFCCLSY